ncbi:uncharacterized protein EDC56_2699 [Sinobacterium caligoides]|uniref:Large ribosomal RNA subunit accumulation protein YceD n=1 Tax=Sinobacterium caligoides TaxID=933926 RepID=A0A3N2DL38_9GAMM|nr:YceD family protein [Sinobacterium caligoides]ROS00065.1 uncharacterized protein EDC56_2699 [Sinobacterium caligoides]
MLDGVLPKHADLHKFAAQGKEIEGQVEVSKMPRLLLSLVDNSGTVSYKLKFVFEQGRIPTVRGQVQANVQILCQRCMKAMSQDLYSDIAIGVVRNDEQAQQLPRSLDPLMVESDESVSLLEVVEDELIISVPAANYHAEADCESSVGFTSQDDDYIEKVPDEIDNPFKVLKSLKGKCD